MERRSRHGRVNNFVMLSSAGYFLLRSTRQETEAGSERGRGGCAHRRARYTFYCRWKDGLLESVVVTGAINPLDPSSAEFLFPILPREKSFCRKSRRPAIPVPFNIIWKSRDFSFFFYFLSCQYYLERMSVSFMAAISSLILLILWEILQ